MKRTVGICFYMLKASVIWQQGAELFALGFLQHVPQVLLHPVTLICPTCFQCPWALPPSSLISIP